MTYSKTCLPSICAKSTLKAIRSSPIFADHPLSHGYAEAGITNSMQESGDLPLAGHTAGERGGEKSSRLLPAR